MIATTENTAKSAFDARFANAGTPTVSDARFSNAGSPTVSLKENVCIMCKDREPTALFSPCGHTSCMVCVLLLESTDRKCPQCRGKIIKVKDIY